MVLCSFFLNLSLGQEARGAVILTTSFAISEQYNDNIFFSEEDQQSDFTTILSPSLSLALTSKHATLKITYQGSASIHSKQSDADGYFQALSFEIDLPILNRQIRGLEVRVTENISYTPELPAFSSRREESETNETFTPLLDERFNQVLLSGEGVQTERVDIFQNSAGVALHYPWSKNITTSASYENVITRFSGGGLKDSEINLGTMEAKYHYQMSRRTKWTSSYGVFATFGEGYDQFHAIEAGVVHQLTRLVSVGGAVGISLKEGKSPNTILDIALSKQYKTGSLDFLYTSRLVTGQGVIRGVTRRQNVIASNSLALGVRTSGFVQLGYTDNKDIDGNEVDVSTFTAGLGVSMRLLSWLNGSLNYSYLRQQSDGKIGKDGERNTIGFFLTAIGPSWRMIK